MRSSAAVAPAASETPPLDPEYVARRDEIALLAAGPEAPPAEIAYTELENKTWALAVAVLRERWDHRATPEILAASARLGLPSYAVPQLEAVTMALRPRTGFEYRAVPGLVPVETFFGALANGRFLSTQYLRHHSSPLYTPEPDIIHEVVGHGTCLAQPHLAMLHREAGAAMLRLETAEARQFLANVFWFSAEFGVVVKDFASPESKPLAYGAGLLSSVGEIDWFVENAQVLPVDINQMGTLDYDISRYQPTLFGVQSLTHLLDSVGEFFATASTEDIERRLALAA